MNAWIGGQLLVRIDVFERNPHYRYGHDEGDEFAHSLQISTIICGVFGVVRFDNPGNAKALTRGTSDRTDSTLFRMYKSTLLTVRTGVIGQNITKPMEKLEPLSPDKIRSGQELINSKIFERAEKLELSNDDLEPLPDGVYNIEGYCKSSPRIMWILKQPYDDMKEGKPSGGGWEVYGAFNNDDAFKITTWQPIIYSLFGIRNHKLYGDSDVPYIRDDKSMVDLLKDIAYINIDKMPGSRPPSDAELAEAYELWKDIVEEQICLYDPQVICFANTMWLFKKDWGIDEHTKHESIPLGNDKNMFVYRKDGRLCLDTYHPAQRVVARESYVDAIIKAVNDL